MNSPEIVIEMLNKAHTVGLLCHTSPDGDAMGSSLGLSHTLRAMGKETVLYCPDAVPAWIMKSLPGAADYTDRPEDLDRADLLVWIDCGDAARAGAEAAKLAEASDRPVLNIDHHGTNPRFGAAYWVEETGACAEIIEDMICRAGWTLTREAGLCLYAGIVTDTGRFTYSSANGDTFRSVAYLLDRGIDPTPVIEAFYRTSSLGRTRLLAACLGTLRVECGGKACILTGDRAMQRDAGAVPADYESIVNYAVEIEGSEIGVLIRETGDDRWKISLRSRGRFPVNGLAKIWNGGGHAAAAGASLEGSLDSVLKTVIAGLEEVLQ